MALASLQSVIGWLCVGLVWPLAGYQLYRRKRVDQDNYIGGVTLWVVLGGGVATVTYLLDMWPNR